ncbi:Smr/MutS family protein [Flammeovirga kamogawensis]|uniref:DUF2027 domain-containing protein n=1 Tax=Flammeovirga kamogawensis TaxID=373891 RepID=A0ABX8GY99_9BACT|nr:DUF2027 domain-containing protein [Flammeovirga kamogawensis]MBB6458975.1 hypothetical protein [Flammeovirga kamogawensis]QWG08550.1 DUF2027 domain-containing protein [Flammeovirga kamogawensis]TRX66841.1 DUF2027 domain-containing protein [Flammeovirga kamogawensis]
MNIGDKVRSLHDAMEGIVVSFKKNSIVEVEVEDGFRMDFLSKDLAIVSTVESKEFGSVEEEDRIISVSQKKKHRDRPKAALPLISERGVFIAFVHQNDQILDVYVCNNSDLTIPFVLGSERKGDYKGIFTSTLVPRSQIKVDQVTLQNFEEWPAFIFQALFFYPGTSINHEPLVKKLRFKASTFFNNKKEVPGMNKEGYLFQLDIKALEAVDASKLKDGILEKKEVAQVAEKVVQKPASEIDLHAEALGLDPNMGNSTLSMQVLHFEKELDAAIVNGMDHITFIHGIGSGKLKNEIQKRLSKHADIEYFEDARKEKFGYGATFVKIK